jgi:hypothetical protein
MGSLYAKLDARRSEVSGDAREVVEGTGEEGRSRVRGWKGRVPRRGGRGRRRRRGRHIGLLSIGRRDSGSTFEDAQGGVESFERSMPSYFSEKAFNDNETIVVVDGGRVERRRRRSARKGSGEFGWKPCRGGIETRSADGEGFGRIVKDFLCSREGVFSGVSLPGRGKNAPPSPSTFTRPSNSLHSSFIAQHNSRSFPIQSRCSRRTPSSSLVPPS